MSCPVCVETYNRSDRAEVKCEHGDCEWSACKACVRQYLLGTTSDPHCMNCRKGWTNEYLIQKLNKSWMIKDYREHRTNLLLEREMSKMPETVHAAERVQQCREESKKIGELRKQVLELEKQKHLLEQQMTQHHHNIQLISNGKNSSEKRKFIMACPMSGCRGYLSSAYKCELCNMYTCKDCLEIIGPSKENHEHKCNPDSVKSAEMIRKDTKPCPTCGERIFKISGCDQMWCPHDNTAFSWKTGAIDTGIVHNPHFYQAQRNQANGAAPPRNPGDVLCGGLIQYNTLRHNILHRLDRRIPEHKSLYDKILTLHQSVGHITHAMLDTARTKVRELSNNEPTRVLYILGDKTKKELADIVSRNDRLRMKWTELLHIYELMSVVGIETFANIVTIDAPAEKTYYYIDVSIIEIIKYIEQYHNVRKLCNKQLQRISVYHNMTVSQWDDSWTIFQHKFKTKDL